MSGSASIVVRPGDLCGITQGSRAKDYQASPYTATAATHNATNTQRQPYKHKVQKYKHTNTQIHKAALPKFTIQDYWRHKY